MRHLVQRSLPGIVLTMIALAISVAVSGGTNLNLGWPEVALIALGLAVIASLALAMPPTIFRPIAPVGFDVSDVYVRTEELERRTAHLEHRGGKRRSRFLWNLVPLTIAIVAVLVVSAV